MFQATITVVLACFVATNKHFEKLTTPEMSKMSMLLIIRPVDLSM